MEPPQLRTAEQVREYLAQIFPTREFSLLQSRHAWICREILTPTETAEGMDLGLASYAVDKETGVVTTQSSLALTTIGETYDAAIETGTPIQAEQIYPPLNRLTLQQIRQDPETIEYLVTVESIATTPPTREVLSLTVDKVTLETTPYTPLAPMVAARAAWSRQRNGTWPTTETFEV
ncbi:hypothetical protein AB0H98_11295 [Nocardia salmonicida]|uniref:hypothetical protein n=1 Tax=Nocardia salmonicida TaxID=53431 RepID=UPI0033E12CFD